MFERKVGGHAITSRNADRAQPISPGKRTLVEQIGSPESPQLDAAATAAVTAEAEADASEASGADAIGGDGTGGPVTATAAPDGNARDGSAAGPARRPGRLPRLQLGDVPARSAAASGVPGAMAPQLGGGAAPLALVPLHGDARTEQRAPADTARPPAIAPAAATHGDATTLASTALPSMDAGADAATGAAGPNATANTGAPSEREPGPLTAAITAPAAANYVDPAAQVPAPAARAPAAGGGPAAPGGAHGAHGGAHPDASGAAHPDPHAGAPPDPHAGEHHDAHGHGGHDDGHAAHAVPAPGEAAVPHLPAARFAEAARRIQRAATTEKQAIHAAAQREQQTVTAEAGAKAAAIQHAGAAKIASILASIDQKRAAISAAFAQARTAVTARTAAQRQAAQTSGAKALADLRKLITDKKQAAKDGAEKEAKALEATGRHEADRARHETSTTVAAIQSAASSACNSVGGDADVQAAVHKAVDDAKSDALAKAQKQGGDVAAKAEKDAKDGAQKIREGGDKLSSEVGDKSSDVEKTITDATRAAIDRINTIEQTNLQQLDTLERQNLAALDKLKAGVAPPIRSAASRAAAQARQAGRNTASGVKDAATAQSRAIDHAAQQAHARLGALPQHAELSAAKLDHAVVAITTSFSQIHRDGTAAITAEATKVKTRLGQIQHQFSANLTGAASRLDGEIAKAVSGAHQGVGQVTSKVDEDTRSALDDMHQGHGKALGDYGTQLQQKINDGNQRWIKQRGDHETKIRDDVTHGLQGVIDLRSQVGPKFQGIAQKAKEKQDRPWWKKALSGIWEGLKSFVGGLLVFLAAVIIVALVMLLFVSGIGEALAIAFEIVGIAFLVVGFVSSLISRWGQLMARLRSGHYPWYAVLGLGALTIVAAAGDVFGVTPLVEGIVGYDAVTWQPLSTEERWKRGTQGALTLITLGLLREAKVDGEDPEVDGRGPGLRDRLGSLGHRLRKLGTEIGNRVRDVATRIRDAAGKVRDRLTRRGKGTGDEDVPATNQPEGGDRETGNGEPEHEPHEPPTPRPEHGGREAQARELALELDLTEAEALDLLHSFDARTLRDLHETFGADGLRTLARRPPEVRDAFSRAWNAAGHDPVAREALMHGARLNDRGTLSNDGFRQALDRYAQFRDRYGDRVSGDFLSRFWRSLTKAMDPRQAEDELRLAEDLLAGDTPLGDVRHVDALPERGDQGERVPEYRVTTPDGALLAENKTIGEPGQPLSKNGVRNNAGSANEQLRKQSARTGEIDGLIRLDGRDAGNTDVTPETLADWVSSKLPSPRDSKATRWVEIFYRDAGGAVWRVVLEREGTRFVVRRAEVAR